MRTRTAAAVSAQGTHVLFLLRALLAVKGVGAARRAADDAAAAVRAKVALVAHAHGRRRPHVRIADHALAVALFAQAANGCEGIGAEE